MKTKSQIIWACLALIAQSIQLHSIRIEGENEFTSGKKPVESIANKAEKSAILAIESKEYRTKRPAVQVPGSVRSESSDPRSLDSSENPGSLKEAGVSFPEDLSPISDPGSPAKNSDSTHPTTKKLQETALSDDHFMQEDQTIILPKIKWEDLGRRPEFTPEAASKMLGLNPAQATTLDVEMIQKILLDIANKKTSFEQIISNKKILNIVNTFIKGTNFEPAKELTPEILKKIQDSEFPYTNPYKFSNLVKMVTKTAMKHEPLKTNYETTIHSEFEKPSLDDVSAIHKAQDKVPTTPIQTKAMLAKIKLEKAKAQAAIDEKKAQGYATTRPTKPGTDYHNARSAYDVAADPKTPAQMKYVYERKAKASQKALSDAQKEYDAAEADAAKEQSEFKKSEKDGFSFF